MKEFSIRSMKYLIKFQGSKRVSKGSAEELGDILETFAGDVAEEAWAIAQDDGMNTVRPEHIQEALG